MESPNNEEIRNALVRNQSGGNQGPRRVVDRGSVGALLGPLILALKIFTVYSITVAG